MIGKLAAVAAVAGGVLALPTTAHAATVRCHGVVATIVGDERSEHITGTAHRDVIAALGGNDTIDGGGGNDLICGGAGNDRINGGAGDDVLYGGIDRVQETDEGIIEKIGDVLDGGRGNDRLVPGHDSRPAEDVTRDIVSWASSTRPVHADLTSGRVTGQGDDHIVGEPVALVGSPFDDLILGSDGPDQIDAGRGSDIVHAHQGDDVVSADPGQRERRSADQVWGGRGDDMLSSREGNDVLRGGSGDDVLDDYAPTADRLYGGPGDDLVVTELAVTEHPQVVDGGDGADRVTLMTNRLNPAARPAAGSWDMSTGRLRLTLDTPLDASVSHFEDADLSTYGTSWTVTGTEGPDILHATGTRGTIFTALGGDDQFMGSGLDDTFLGGAGDDRSLGMGDGDDTCVSVELFDYPDCENVS